MSDGNEAIANLQEKLEQACRLLQQVSDPRRPTVTCFAISLLATPTSPRPTPTRTPRAKRISGCSKNFLFDTPKRLLQQYLPKAEVSAP